MMRNCAAQPRKISLGRVNTRAKSSSLIVSPIPNMISISRGLIQDVWIQSVEAGASRETAAMARTISAMYRPNCSLIFSNTCILAFLPG